MDMDTYVAGKSEIIQKILAESTLSMADRDAVLRLNDPKRG